MKINNLKLVLFLILFVTFIAAQQAFAANLSGRILLQVEDKGQAWYVNPDNDKRYYLGRPDDAFLVMKTLGLGATTKDVNYFLKTQAPSRLAGRILLQVEDKGQAYYINPQTLKLIFLGRPSDAFSIMRNEGLGITNKNLENIQISENSFFEVKNSTPLQNQARVFDFKYRNNNFSINYNFNSALYDSYHSSPKALSYLVNNPPANLQEAFYKIFLQTKTGDDSIKEIVDSIVEIAEEQKWHGDWVAEMVLALVQYIPYDQDKVDKKQNNPYFPYETLYLNKGVCSDKTFLAYQLLKELGYGVAIMDFPDINHSAIGISCPIEDSINGSGYCYGETTNYFPIAVIPNNINGQANVTDYDFDNFFNEEKLGKIEIFNKTIGKSYNQVSVIKYKALTLKNLYQELQSSRENLNNNDAISAYNEKVDEFNNLLSDFYQK